ncbi:MAG TPA: hypothetical protein VGG33_06350, partial [Polyangia bacterium]
RPPTPDGSDHHRFLPVRPMGQQLTSAGAAPRTGAGLEPQAMAFSFRVSHKRNGLRNAATKVAREEKLAPRGVTDLMTNRVIVVMTRVALGGP